MKKIKRLLAYVSCAAMVATSFTAVSAAGKTVFVSPGESVQAAIDAAENGSVIVLRGGSYNESINLNKSNITIKAENGADVVFSTSETGKLEDITKEEKDRIALPDIKKEIRAIRTSEKFEQNLPAVLQNGEYLPIAVYEALGKLTKWNYDYDQNRSLTSDGYLYKDTKVIRADDPSGVIVHGIMDNQEFFVPLNIEKLFMTFTVPEDNSVTYSAPYNITEYVNDFSFIDEKGEWYADRESGTIFIYPKDGAADVEFITDDKTYILGDKLSNVKISGIKFSDTLGSAIDIKNSENIEILDCQFENTSDTAVKLEKCNDSKIDNCDFNNLGGGAVLIDGNLNTVDNCGFSKIGCLYFKNHEPVKIDGSKNTISHNDISDTSNTALYIGGNENTVEFNDISGALTRSGGSVILVSDGALNNKIIGNYIYDNNEDAEDKDKYDTYGDRYIQQKSTVGRITTNYYDYALGLYGTSGNEIKNNYFSGKLCGINLAVAKDNVISNNLIFTDGFALNEIVDFNKSAEEFFKTSDNNIIRNNFKNSTEKLTVHTNGNFETRNTVENFNISGKLELIDDNLKLYEDVVKSKNPDFEIFSLDTVGRYEVQRADEPETTGAVTLLVGSNKFGVNGEIRENDVQPMIIDGRTLVPVRCISESFGEEVSWDADTKTVSVGSGISIVIGDKNITVGGEKREIDVPAAIYDSRTFVPLRAIAEALGKSVTWDERGLIVITDTETEFSENELSAMIAELK